MKVLIARNSKPAAPFPSMEIAGQDAGAAELLLGAAGELLVKAPCYEIAVINDKWSFSPSSEPLPDLHVPKEPDLDVPKKPDFDVPKKPDLDVPKRPELDVPKR
jgi:hypothetical protein